MDGVGTSIVGRPRRLSADRRARPTYTFIWEEPFCARRHRLAALALPGGFLILITVLALVSALSKHPSRSDAAYRTLALIWTRQPQDEVSGAPDPEAQPPALPLSRRPR